ncbi:MAG: Stf0 family sulfotransferase [Aestuariivirgaceae bacterium]|nr:Stf0 family sulfotransferase [Aestuariivirgaceae bacterium]
MGIFTSSIRVKPPQNWVPPKLNYVIAAEARTGSNFLQSALTNTKVLGAPTEYFNRTMIQQNHFHGADGSVEKQCWIARQTASGPGDVCGIKIFPGQFDWAASRVQLTDWFPDMNWIWLRRRDVLGQAISWEFAMQSKAWSSKQEMRQQPSYNFRGIGSKLVRATIADARWNHYFAAAGITPTQVWFEDLPNGGLEKVVGELADKANVVPAPNWKSSIDIKRQFNPVKDEWRERFIEDSRADPHPLMRPKINFTLSLLKRWLKSELRPDDVARRVGAKA